MEDVADLAKSANPAFSVDIGVRAILEYMYAGIDTQLMLAKWASTGD